MHPWVCPTVGKLVTGCTHMWCKSTGPEHLLTAAPESILLSTRPESLPPWARRSSGSWSTPDSCSPQWRAPPVTFIFFRPQRQFFQLPPIVLPSLFIGTCLYVYFTFKPLRRFLQNLNCMDQPNISFKQDQSRSFDLFARLFFIIL